ncbi:hypothetical protein COOONC_19982 [Cooperia oncophora]
MRLNDILLLQCLPFQKDICERFFITKYPTMKLFVFGDMLLHEYRGSREVNYLRQYVIEHYTSTVKIFADESFRRDMDQTKGNVIAYIRKDGEAYRNIHNIALLLREYCDFWVPTDEISNNLSQVRITFKAADDGHESEFVGSPQNYTYLKDWISDKCIPVVREVHGFGNVEGPCTDEGLPFLTSFSVIQKRKMRIRCSLMRWFRELYGTRMTINPLLADAYMFAHPLQHLGKTYKDLPVLAIDSFTHMYVFPDISKLSTPGVLKQFVDDLHSGVLHQRYHGQAEVKRQELQKFKQEHNIQADLEDRREEEQMATDVPPSVFKELRPSEKRYSLLQKTEL